MIIWSIFWKNDMNLRYVFILLTSITPLVTYSQDRVNKQEIYRNWIEDERTYGYKNQFDSLTVRFIDNLKNSGVDTIGVFKSESVGAVTTDSCRCGLIPWDTCVQWVKNGISFHQKITKCCEFRPIKIESSALIRYYVNCKTEIDKSRILPVITGAYRNQKGHLIFEMIVVDHTTHYTIFCDLNGHYRLIKFQSEYLTNENNIFYKENNQSIINSWKEIIKSQISELDN